MNPEDTQRTVDFIKKQHKLFGDFEDEYTNLMLKVVDYDQDAADILDFEGKYFEDENCLYYKTYKVLSDKIHTYVQKNIMKYENPEIRKYVDTLIEEHF